jgi:hypothetical protein
MAYPGGQFLNDKLGGSLTWIISYKHVRRHQWAYGSLGLEIAFYYCYLKGLS